MNSFCTVINVTQTGNKLEEWSCDSTSRNNPHKRFFLIQTWNHALCKQGIVLNIYTWPHTRFTYALLMSEGHRRSYLWNCVFVYTCHVSVLLCVRGYVLFSLLMQGFMFMYLCVDSLWSRFILDFCKVIAHRLRFPMCLWVKIPGPVTRHPINYPPIKKNGNRKAPLSVIPSYLFHIHFHWQIVLLKSGVSQPHLPQNRRGQGSSPPSFLWRGRTDRQPGGSSLQRFTGNQRPTTGLACDSNKLW